MPDLHQQKATTHPYFKQISRVFYDYRLADYNLRYYAVLLERAEGKNRTTQIIAGILTVVAVAMLTIPAALSDEKVIPLIHRINPIAAGLSALAFVVTVLLPLFGLDKAIDDYRVRHHAWQFAKNQIEAALRSLIQRAQSDCDAGWMTTFAETAFASASNLLQVGKDDPKLAKRLRDEVESTYPPNYPWIAF